MRVTPPETVQHQSKVKPGGWRVGKQGEHVRNIDANKINETVEKVDELSVEVLIEPALKVFPQFRKRKYIKKGNNANMIGYDKRSWMSRKQYHKAKHIYNLYKSTLNYSCMISKSNKYNKRDKKS